MSTLPNPQEKLPWKKTARKEVEVSFFQPLDLCVLCSLQVSVISSANWFSLRKFDQGLPFSTFPLLTYTKLCWKRVQGSAVSLPLAALCLKLWHCGVSTLVLLPHFRAAPGRMQTGSTWARPVSRHLCVLSVKLCSGGWPWILWNPEMIVDSVPWAPPQLPPQMHQIPISLQGVSVQTPWGDSLGGEFNPSTPYPISPSALLTSWWPWQDEECHSSLHSSCLVLLHAFLGTHSDRLGVEDRWVPFPCMEALLLVLAGFCLQSHHTPSPSFAVLTKAVWWYARLCYKHCFVSLFTSILFVGLNVGFFSCVGMEGFYFHYLFRLCISYFSIAVIKHQWLMEKELILTPPPLGGGVAEKARIGDNWKWARL